MKITQLNFRDLGEIPAWNGRIIRKGLLFRSGDLNHLTAKDILQLEMINLAMIIDLRAQREIDKHPDKIIGSVKSVVHIDIHDGARDKAETLIEENNFEAVKTVLEHDYRRMIHEHLPEFRQFLHVLATTDQLPLVFHCAAGKDRTGLCSVFLLTALEVPMNLIWEDYLETNRRVAPATEKIIHEFSAQGKNGEILRPLLEVRREYLEAALDEINLHFGNLETYVNLHLQADREKLRLKFLTPE